MDDHTFTKKRGAEVANLDAELPPQKRVHVSTNPSDNEQGRPRFTVEDIYVNKKILAPLVGGSDVTFRRLCRLYGADTTFTEMNIAEYWIKKNILKDKTKLKKYTFEFHEEDRPLVCQFAGNTPEPIIQLATMDFLKDHIDAVDINCGCPQSFASEKGIGAFILKTPDILVDLCKQVVNNVHVPVSVKLRLHEDVPTTIGIIDRLINVGVKAITVHGRFWWQKGEKRGRADWDAIRQIREKFPNFPIIGNGDVTKFEDFEAFKQVSGVDSVMVGYGALLDPTVFSPQQGTISIDSVLSSYLNLARQHENTMIDIARHIQWITKRRNPPVEFKTKLFNSYDLEDIRNALLSLDPPIQVEISDLPPGQVDKISYPTKVEDMTPKMKKKYLKKLAKQERKLERKLRNKAARGELDAQGPSVCNDGGVGDW